MPHLRMLLFSCDECGQQLYFESTSCTQCKSPLGYWPEKRALFALKQESPQHYSIQHGSRQRFALCDNAIQHDACNWLVREGSPTNYCASCALSEIIPNLSNEQNRQAWKRLEAAKRRLLFTLQALNLPVKSKAEDPDRGLAFRFMEGKSDQPITTGHDCGTITLNIAEADPAYRERQRQLLDEKYRTPLGHLRHEIGHYYFEQLILESERPDKFRELFGDERADYQQALERHYDAGPPHDWQQTHISAYATMHPWEDWAESFAHYLHMVDTLETAQSYGLVVTQPNTTGPDETMRAKAVDVRTFSALMQGFHALALALNGLNRSMGLQDAYPFAISPAAANKLEFVHDVIAELC